MKLPYIALAAVAAALLSSPAHAQEEVVKNQLDQATTMMGERGFVPIDDAVMGTLPEGEDEEFEVDLEAGSHYMVVGFCDGDCSDLDLVLSDGDDEVAADREMDDYPVLSIDDRSGTFVLSVQMATCSSSECHYGVRIYRRQ